MNKSLQNELEKILATRNNAIAEKDIALVKTLLKELARRLLLWRQAIHKKHPDIEFGANILFDVAFTITGNRTELPNIESLSLSYFDKLILASYFNYQEEEINMRNLGYGRANPYIPYVEIFKLGGHLLKYEYTRLEVYPFIGINVYPQEHFLVDIPFWTNSDDDSTFVDIE